MNVLVTGAAGYIGSHTCKALHEKGISVKGMDNFRTGSTSFTKWGEFTQYDIRMPLNLSHVDTVIHCAAVSTIGECISNPIECYDINVGGTINILSAMKKYGVKKIVFAGTCSVYQENPYSMSKRMGESIIKDSGIDYVILRYYNVAGSGGDTGEIHDAHLIPLAIRSALTGEPMDIYGYDYDNTPDGTAIRDYIHVNDIASLNVKYASECHYLTREAGSGVGRSVKEIISLVEEETGKRIKVNLKPRRKGDASCLVAPYASSSTPLRSIIKSAIEWYKK